MLAKLFFDGLDEETGIGRFQAMFLKLIDTPRDLDHPERGFDSKFAAEELLHGHDVFHTYDICDQASTLLQVIP